MRAALLVVGVVALLAVVNARRPASTSWLVPVTWPAALLAIELAPLLIASGSSRWLRPATRDAAPV